MATAEASIHYLLNVARANIRKGSPGSGEGSVEYPAPHHGQPDGWHKAEPYGKKARLRSLPTAAGTQRAFGSKS